MRNRDCSEMGSFMESERALRIVSSIAMVEYMSFLEECRKAEAEDKSGKSKTEKGKNCNSYYYSRYLIRIFKTEATTTSHRESK